MPHIDFKKTIHSSGPITLLLVSVTIAVYVFQRCLSMDTEASNVVYELGSLNASAIRDGEYWRLFTYMFLHGSMLHIGFNMYALANFSKLERLLPQYVYLGAYIFYGVVAGIVSFITHFDTKTFSVGTVGASGAIFGVIGMTTGFMLYLFYKEPDVGQKKVLVTLFLVAAGNLVVGFLVNADIGITMIDNACHLGGYGSGIVSGLLIAWHQTRSGNMPFDMVEKSPSLTWHSVLHKGKEAFRSTLTESNSSEKALITLTVYKENYMWLCCVEFGEVVAKASYAVSREAAMNWCIKYTTQELQAFTTTVNHTYFNHIIKQGAAQ